MKKRLAAVLLASLLAVSPAALWAADAETDEIIWMAESIAEEVLASDQDTIDSLIEQVLPEGMTKEQAAEYLRLTAEVVTSEEFQSLLAHVEVQELLQEVIRHAAVLVEEDPELVKEILTTLGIKEGVTDFLLMAYDHMDVVILLAEEYLESDQGKQLIGALGEMAGNVNYQKLIQGLAELMDTGTPALPESAEEPPEGEAETAAGQE